MYVTEEEELEYIRKFDVVMSNSNVLDLINFIKDLWVWKDYIKIIHEEDKIIVEMCTGGWSEHEDIIEALMDNRMFWTMYWQKSERGGKYTFEIPLVEGSI
jgi:hypothetical protein